MCNLRDLTLSSNDLNKAIPLLSSALIHSKIKCITLELCNIDDDGLYCLFEALRQRHFFMLNIDLNPRITALGLNKCLSMLLKEEFSRIREPFSGSRGRVWKGCVPRVAKRAIH